MTATPAQVYRFAAQEVLKAGAAAAPWPWGMNQFGNVESAGHQEVAEVWPLELEDPYANVRWITMMDPGFAKPLAAVLEHEAMSYDAAVSAAVRVWPDDPKAQADFVLDRVNTATLELAHMILDSVIVRSGE